MNFDLLKWVDPSFFIYVLLALILNAAVAILWQKKCYKRLGLEVYATIQRIHLAEMPRLGGLIIIIVLSLYTYFHAEPEVAGILNLCLWSMLPLVLVTVKEDLFQDVLPLGSKIKITGDNEETVGTIDKYYDGYYLASVEKINLIKKGNRVIISN